jgi:protein SCO1/2
VSPRQLAVLVLLIPAALAAKTYMVDGILIAADPVARTMLVSHRPIPGYMGAMMMPFRVADPHELDGLNPGVRIRFELVIGKDRSVARRIVKTGAADAEIPALKARLRVGDPLPDFSLTDQTGASVSAADLRGKVAAIHFIYTRCPLPDVCPRLAAAFAALQHRFHDQVGRSLLLLSVTVDPDYDTPPTLAAYAKRWAADPRGWRFLTGDVASLAAALGEVYWSDEGSIGHNSVTTIVGRKGRIAAAIDGSSYRAGQLIDLVAHELEVAP